MKKIIFLLLSVMCMNACSPIKNKKYENPNNHDFIKIFRDYKSFVGNDIQENEAYKRRDVQLREDLDFCGVYNNLKCKMNGLALKDFGEFKIMDFNIIVKVDDSFSIDFNCVHAIHEKELESDYLYNKFKDISSYADVYIDGVIAYDVKKDMLDDCNLSKSLRFSYPDYKFHVIDVSTLKLDTINDNLKLALIAARKSFNIACKKTRKDSSFSQKDLNKSISDYQKIIKVLSEKDKIYVERYKDYINNDLF